MNRRLTLLAIAAASVAIVALIFYASIKYGGNNDGQTVSKNPAESKANNTKSDIQDDELQSEMKETWMTFTTALKAADKKQLQELSTQRGYECLVDADIISFAGRQSNDRQSDDTRFLNTSHARFSVSVGPTMKQSGWHFVKERGKWKLDEYYPGR